ncbi:hypothetical protein ACIBL3_05635 [Kribbella sp. NPDC050124]|uniref:hypothetical protein n=1 Tax=Kribbella sp. NPDC050124 TaxID=3364114 RepID=UPI0037933E3B
MAACQAEYERRADPPIGPTAAKTAPRLAGRAFSAASTASSGLSIVDEQTSRM